MQFDQPSFFQDALSILPEIIVTITLLAVVVLDIIFKDSSLLSNTSLLGLSGSLFVLLTQWNHSASTSFSGSIQLNVFNIAFCFVVVLSAILCIFMSTEYVIRSGMGLAEFLILILGSTLGGMFLCIANELITIFVAFECLGLSSYILAGYAKKDLRSNEAAIKYLLVGGVSSSILAYGFSWLYGLSGGQLQLDYLVNGIADHNNNILPVWISFICILVGICFKISAVPFHQWAPDVYEGSPTPVVAFLSVGSKAAGLALATRILTIVFPSIQQEWHLVLEIFGFLSMMFGNLIAATQTSLKRMLAYSSISQAGYLIIGIVANTPYGYTSMITYLIIYVFMNLGAFACVVIFGLRTGTDQIRDYTGLYFKDPWLAFSLSVCLLSLGGIPPLAGFFGKLYLFWCGWNSGLYLLVYTGLFTSVISIYYYLRVVKVILTKEAKEMSPYLREYKASPFSLIPNNNIEFGITLCVFVSTTLGFVLNPIINTTNQILITQKFPMSY